jgi:hypothetical protein
MMLPKGVAIVGAFFMEGVRDAGDYIDVLNMWNRGAVEFVVELTQYAELTWELAETGGAITGNFPGVFDYEVSSSFGTWFANRLLERCHVPEKAECIQWLLKETMSFFTWGETDPEMETRLRDALLATVKRVMEVAPSDH